MTLDLLLIYLAVMIFRRYNLVTYDDSEFVKEALRPGAGLDYKCR